MPPGKRNKILIVCPHPEGTAPGQRLKYEQYFGYFRDSGFDVVVKSFMSARFQNMVYKKGNLSEKIFWTLAGYCRRFLLLFSLRKYEIVYIFLWVTPFGPPFFEWLYCKLGKRIIYDIDDMIYLKAPHSPNPGVAWLKGKTKPIFLFKKADYVLTSTPAIEEYAKRFNDKVINIPVTIDTVKYTPKEKYDTEKITLGWSGSVSTSPYLHLLDNMLLELHKKHDFKLFVMGDPNFKIEGLEIEAIPWKEEYEVSTIRRFDIGLYPLPHDNWVHGKGGGKALQYMAAGVPTVATAVGANFKIIENGVSGYLVKMDEEWLDRIEKLMESETLRKQIGQKGAKIVQDHFSVHANKEVYLSVLREALLQ